MPYVPPSAEEIRILIKTYWQQHWDPVRRGRAEDKSFADLKVQATQDLLRGLIRRGMFPLEAEHQVMTTVTLAD